MDEGCPLAPSPGQMKALPVILLLLTDPWGPLGTCGGPRSPPGLLYPYGAEAGDEATPHEDDGMSPEIILWETFSFYGHPYRSVYVNNNGVLSFGIGVPEFTPQAFPLAGARPLVAPYWADVDTRLGGDVFYRQSRDPRLLARLGRDLAAVTVGQAPSPTWALVATWDRVSYFGAASDKVNTFQAVLATDGAASFVIFNYGDLQWTTGISNQGDPHSGLGGIAAQAGFDSGPGGRSFTLPGSRSPAVLSLGRRSNAGTPGRWIFRVDRAPTTPGPTEPHRGHGGTEERVYVCG
ncbi:sushi, nidogen and EGF-like domain-containing protein 1 [Pezoporus flaviventris]|uniref:sushi, nidogen and EGF-like domain-containing protein 1 n=1 Tax=Pezoporus flaviventris TaxID=889875 RepID=UPI002AB16E8A|nr:sushi, nidogen and EGF-like domain-containing protein 1 [Pezoporus flaviventris]